MSIFIFRSVLVYIKLAALSETLLRIEQVCCITEFLFGKGFFYKHMQALAVLLQRKYCLRFVYGQKFCYQLRIRPVNVSAQNLGVRFFGKIQIRILVSKNGFCVSLPKIRKWINQGLVI